MPRVGKIIGATPVLGPTSSLYHPPLFPTGPGNVTAGLSFPSTILGGRWFLAPLNCIHHLLSQVKYSEVKHEAIELPPRVHDPNYRREPISARMIVPEIY